MTHYLQQQCIDILETAAADNTNARLLQADGTYIRIKPGRKDPIRNSQEEFMTKAKQ